MKANTLNPDQKASNQAAWSMSVHKQIRKQKTLVVTARLWLIILLNIRMLNERSHSKANNPLFSLS